ncbi:MAG: hypothetical protein J0L64_08910 [Acidobacteria bacterium]|nr:hypothetical protein [Acidobacteriota bacterium]
MSQHNRVWLALAAGAVALMGQTGEAQWVSRELVFRHADTAQQFRQAAGIVRVVTELPEVSVLETAGRLRLRGPEARMEAAEWLFRQLDRPLEREARAESEGHQLRDLRGDSNLVRVFRLARAGKQGRLDALAGMVRMVIAGEWVLVYSSPPSIVLRGTAQELELGSFLLGELDRGPGEGATSGGEFKLQERGNALAVRVMLLRAMPDEELRQAAEEMRKAAQARVALDPELPALVVRGWPELMEAGQQRLRERGWLR